MLRLGNRFTGLICCRIVLLVDNTFPLISTTISADQFIETTRDVEVLESLGAILSNMDQRTEGITDRRGLASASTELISQSPMCILYSVTKSQVAIIAIVRGHA